ncbi:hypothetical protein ANN_06920 [Periplaneta americana]|uniref:Uncharacterized protein n=1 Tax=Periplaneta americana TaxID=6978 RepID=A0ABQ8TF01_PERAM|nr:hypothetical protein ANN_06920 [Periplaneta americana]
MNGRMTALIRYCRSLASTNAKKRLTNTKAVAELPMGWVRIMVQARSKPTPFDVVVFNQDMMGSWESFLQKKYLRKYSFLTRPIRGHADAPRTSVSSAARPVGHVFEPRCSCHNIMTEHISEERRSTNVRTPVLPGSMETSSLINIQRAVETEKTNYRNTFIEEDDVYIPHVEELPSVHTGQETTSGELLVTAGTTNTEEGSDPESSDSDDLVAFNRNVIAWVQNMRGINALEVGQSSEIEAGHETTEETMVVAAATHTDDSYLKRSDDKLTEFNRRHMAWLLKMRAINAMEVGERRKAGHETDDSYLKRWDDKLLEFNRRHMEWLLKMRAINAMEVGERRKAGHEKIITESSEEFNKWWLQNQQRRAFEVGETFTWEGTVAKCLYSEAWWECFGSASRS